MDKTFFPNSLENITPVCLGMDILSSASILSVFSFYKYKLET